MQHILDNPIYNSLNTFHKGVSSGSENAKWFPFEMSPLTGLKNNTGDDLDDLYAADEKRKFFIIFTNSGAQFSSKWKLLQQMQLLQMVYLQPEFLPAAERDYVILTEEHIPQMLSLTALTRPGPFSSRTIDFGNYIGIIDNGRLAAMVGYRMQPAKYIEVSAVCTHPDYLGKGYAGQLIGVQVKAILAAGCTPFLHVLKENTRAIKVYEKLGFTVRHEMIAYAFTRQ